jgi:hypothetical protein
VLDRRFSQCWTVLLSADPVLLQCWTQCRTQCCSSAGPVLAQCGQVLRCRSLTAPGSSPGAHSQLALAARPALLRSAVPSASPVRARAAPRAAVPARRPGGAPSQTSSAPVLLPALDRCGLVLHQLWTQLCSGFGLVPEFPSAAEWCRAAPQESPSSSPELARFEQRTSTVIW